MTVYREGTKAAAIEDLLVFCDESPLNAKEIRTEVDCHISWAYRVLRRLCSSTDPEGRLIACYGFRDRRGTPQRARQYRTTRQHLDYLKDTQEQRQLQKAEQFADEFDMDAAYEKWARENC